MRTIAVEWRNIKTSGTVKITNGELGGISVSRGEGSTEGERFSISGNCRLEISVDKEDVSLGGTPTFITIDADTNPFTVLLRDVSSRYPVYIPEYGVVVTESIDSRSCDEIAASITSKGLKTALRQMDEEPEESYENAAKHTRSLRCPTWLGIGRDIRLFEIDLGFEERAHYIKPRFHTCPVELPETAGKPVWHSFMVGRGIGCAENISRRLENGTLPVLYSRIDDGDVTYNLTMFTTLESSPLDAGHVRGTHYLVADDKSGGHMFTSEQAEHLARIRNEELDAPEETVLMCRIRATNNGSVPRYAMYKNPGPDPYGHFDGDNGFGMLDSGRVFVVSRLNGAPLPKEEIAALLAPGDSAEFEFAIPHRPISPERARLLSTQDFDIRLKEARAFWMEKLNSAATVRVPEERITEMVQAGLLHLDITSYGREPDGALAATVGGHYSPIGSESAPIIQFTDSMGCHNAARRMLMYFLEKQHGDGFMQNFNNYMLETGAVLWSIGEHYRYTADDEWARSISEKVFKSCNYLVEWRNRNKKEELRGAGYGLLDGKVADPEDPYRVFMLNGYAYLGLSRMAEMYRRIDPSQAARLATVAEELKKDIRSAVSDSLKRSPVVPLGDGSWSPTLPPWAEASSPGFLLTDSRGVFTHGTFTGRDSLLGPHYLILQEVLSPKEQVSDQLVRYMTELYHMRNVALSQPYYSPHPWIHLKRGEVSAFLKSYYNGFAGLADRETYTFWEHYFFASPHKTHEEAWFLMQTRWMLYMEEGGTLSLLPGIPRAWMENGGSIEIKGAATYFGPLNLSVKSGDGCIHAEIQCGSGRMPESVTLRLPHPQGARVSSVDGGVYDAVGETVVIKPFGGRAEVRVRF